MTLGSTLGIWVQATPSQVLSIRPCKFKFNKEKSKHAGLNQQNGFGPAVLLRLVIDIKA
jgi:hypothetical protein